MIPPLSPNPIHDLQELFTYPFMVNALEAGTIVAVLAGVVGWYVVLRRQTFASHTLSVMAFPGATGAALAGLPTALGYYIACTAAALAIGRSDRGGSGGRGRFGQAGESAVIGTVQTVGLAAGFLFLSLNQAVLGGPETLLFGTFLGITRGQVLGLALVAVAALATLTVLARPLLFASVDREVARASGVPVGLLDALFLLVLGLAIAATSQLTGALLVFALLVAPPAAAQQLTARPLAGLVLTVILALITVWLALAIAYFTIYPVGFYVTTIGFVIYVVARIIGAQPSHHPRHRRARG
ncbi:MAG TPA: iron chelate uptake ABC transporter family permease subunit [Solirubrobacteraceae bacterium]|nr:iron chelate uptake ABC transporter family permease subunit [Solirubrobacteraceae bacterium]